MAIHTARSVFALLLATTVVASTHPGSAKPLHQHQRRTTVNETEQAVCNQLAANASTDSTTHVYTALASFTQYNAYSEHYFSSSDQDPACVFYTSSESDLSNALHIIGQARVRFAIQGAGHASNQGFSSTQGIHISMRGFQQVKLSDDQKSVHVGPANVWDNVYLALEPKGLSVVGGRVTGVGVGGFITGGGGYSWRTNQYGLTGDTLLSARVVLPTGDIIIASPTENEDLFWAIRGGGNRFGIITDFELQTVPQTQVWGGVRTYTTEQMPALINATYAFSENVKDPKAQLLPSFNYVLGAVGSATLAFYDGPTPPNGTFSDFDGTRTFSDDWKTRSFSDLVRSNPVNLTAGNRGVYHTVSLQRYSLELLNVILNETKYYGNLSALHGGTFVSYDIEPFLPYSQYAKDAAWPHNTDALPLNLYFGWIGDWNDDFWQEAIVRSARVIEDAAKAEGQNLSEMYLYPNYAVVGTEASKIYGPNVEKLESLRKTYDPENVMGLTTYHEF